MKQEGNRAGFSTTVIPGPIPGVVTINQNPLTLTPRWPLKQKISPQLPRTEGRRKILVEKRTFCGQTLMKAYDFDVYLALILKNSLKGKVESKASMLSEIIYHKCLYRFRPKGGEEAKSSLKIEECFIRRGERRRPMKARHWGLLQTIKICLTLLRRAEHSQKQRKRKESQRLKFLKDRFKIARSQHLGHGWGRARE